MSAELNELKCREEEWDFRVLSNRLLMKRTDRPDEWSMDALASMALALEARAEDEKMRADTISSRIQEVNDALLVSEARVKELESEDWCRTALTYQARIKELEDREFNRTEQEGRDLDIQRLLI